jgi:hypothetical protein
MLFEEEALTILRALNQCGGRLLGRFNRNAPFLLTDPTHPDANWRGSVDASIADELHSEGLIEIDESAPVDDIYSFQISDAGKAYLAANEPR